MMLLEIDWAVRRVVIIKKTADEPGSWVVCEWIGADPARGRLTGAVTAFSFFLSVLSYAFGPF